MTTALQIGGVAIIALACLQALLALVSHFLRNHQSRQYEAAKLERFRAETGLLLKEAAGGLRRKSDSWSGKRKFRISKKQIENKAGSICSFYLTPHDGGALPSYEPGQFLTFELNIPGQSKPVVRCYSLSDAPGSQDQYRITVKHLRGSEETAKPDGVCSTFFHQMLQVGDVIDVLAPNGQFVLDVQSDRPVVLIAGGVGVTPLLAMLKWLDATASHREVHFVYCARNAEEIAGVEEIREVIARHNNFHLVRFFSSPTKGCKKGRDFDHQGTLSVADLRELAGALNHQYYVCGPPPMMDTIVHQLLDAGVPEGDVHFEAFGPATVRSVAAQEQANIGSSGDVPVKFSRSGKLVAWTDADGSLLDLAEQEGIAVACGCRAGNCGTCATALKAGKVSYFTRPASTPATGSVLLCIARPDGEVELDI